MSVYFANLRRRQKEVTSPKVFANLLVQAIAGFVLISGPPLVWGAAPENQPTNEEVEEAKEAKSESRLSDEPIPLQLDKVPDRPRLLLELGDTFLGTGALGPEITLPTGAVWRPSLWVFGTLRTAVQTFDNDIPVDGTASGASQRSEWANRLDLFGNLKLSASERILIGFRPLDRDNRFSGRLFDPANEWEDATNFVPRTLFLEGDIGEIFPNLDPEDAKALDFGFTVGRQSLLFQEGILINTGGLGNPDAVGLVRNNLQLPGTSNVRASVLYAWNNVFRDDNQEDDDAQLFALLTETDVPVSSFNIDLVYIDSGDQNGDAFFAGLRAVQRIGHFNTTFIVNSSFPDDETPQTSRGTLLFSQVSWIPPYTHNLVYFNAFWGVDDFSSAIRGPETGGPLGRTGILFAAVGLGRYGAALGNQADNSAGGSLGYQMFFHDKRRQLILELGGRDNTRDTDQIANRGALALGARYQHAIGQHIIARLDTFGSVQEDRGPGYGSRLEFLTKF